MYKENELNDKIIGNAISAYFLGIVSILFLFNRDNKYLNNDFVKSHVKVAVLIHLGFFLTYFIFIFFKVGDEINIFNYSINQIIASILFIANFMVLLFGFYKAKLGEIFKLSGLIGLKYDTKLIDINGDMKLDEKDKLSIILAYIPLVGALIRGRFLKSVLITDITKLNLIVSIIVSLLFLFGYSSISTLIFLLYIIFGVFSSVSLISSNQVIHINLKMIPSPEELLLKTSALLKYLRNYLKEGTFVSLPKLIELKKKEKLELEIKNTEMLKLKRETKIPKVFMYIPFLNLFFLFIKNTKYSFHIANGIGITLIFIISWIVLGMDSPYQTLLIIPIFYGIGYIKSRPAYKLPVAHTLYSIIAGFFSKTKNLFSKAKEKHKEEHVVNMKVGEEVKKEPTINIQPQTPEATQDQNLEKIIDIK